MRKLLAVLATAAVALGLGLAGTAGASTAAAKGPVTLKGKVNNKGAGVVKNGAVDVEADNFYFKKTFLKGKAGSTVTVKVENEGSVTHTFTIDNQGIDKTLQPGSKATVKVKIPKNGKIANFYCRFHVGQGMQGAFFSKAGAAATAKDPNSTSSKSSGGYGY
jgi:plastocyanin